jgi:hypothetical protein
MWIEDSRLGPVARHRLGNAAARLLLTCETPTRLDLADPTIAGALAELAELGLVFVEAEKAVALALPRPDQDPAAVRRVVGIFADASAPQPKRLPVVIQQT